jgi:hypothetical protein
LPDYNNLALILAGPILRRVEPTSVSVWLALSKPAQVEVGLWTGNVVASAASGTNFGNASAEKTATANSIRIGNKLHLALVTLDLTASPLTPGVVYSYNVSINAGGVSKDLNGLSLLEDKSTEPKHLAMGYLPNQLPSFAMPPVSLQDLKIVQASCRKAHGGGPDALAGLDTLIKKHVSDGLQRPHQIYMTGDQIYADDIASVLLPELTEAGRQLLGIDEKLTLGSNSFVVNAANFPATWRQELVNEKAKFTSHEAANHALAFGEYCALYLFFWSNVLWPEELKKKAQVFTESGTSAEAIDALPAHLKGLYPEAAAAGASDKEKKKANEAREKAVKDREKLKKEKWEVEIEAVKDFRKALPKVRRAMANIPCLMIFDDHEVTDDWYLVKRWTDQVLTSPLGVNCLRNGLLSYALFQAWGNTPQLFANDADHAALLTAAQNLFPAAASGGPHQATAASIDSLFGFGGSAPKIKWHYSIPTGPTQTLVLDTRTRREFNSRISPPGLLSQTALDEQIPDAAVPSAGAEVLIVVSAAPVLGLALIEEVFQPIMARGATDFVNAISAAFDRKKEPEITGYLEWDMEAWAMSPTHFESLLKKLNLMKKVIILSGDVHYGFSSQMDYWKKGATEPSRIIELCSSALKNEWPAVLKRVLSTGTGQKLLQHSVYPLERVAWKDDLSITGEINVPAGEAIPGTYRTLMKSSPVLLPTEGWPAGTTVSVQPDWSWRVSLLSDERPDDSSADARPTDGQIGNITPDVDINNPVDGYAAVQKRHEKLITRKTPRSVVHNSNIGVITFNGSGASLTVIHDFYYFHPEAETNPEVLKPDEPSAYTSHETSLASTVDTPPVIGS